jgi:outer membrane lipoprotein-sorting protein
MRKLLLTAALASFFAAACVSAATLEQVLAAMDKAAAGFRDMSAKLTRQDHTAIINDTSQESGTVLMKRAGSRDLRVRIEFTEPDRRTILFEKATARIYNPKIQTVQVYDLGKQRNLVDQFLLLGFGSSSADLAKSYSIQLVGEEQVLGQTAARIALTPKSASVKEHLKLAELWIIPAGYPVQQKFHMPSGDYTLITYRDMQMNTNQSDEAFRLALPPGVKTEYPGK